MRLGYNPLDGKFDFRGPLDQVTGTISTLATETVDSIDLNSFNSIEYSFQLNQGSRVRIFRCLITRDGGQLQDQIFGRSGSLNIGISVTLQFGSANIEITNNETGNVDFVFTRLIL